MMVGSPAFAVTALAVSQSSTVPTELRHSEGDKALLVLKKHPQSKGSWGTTTKCLILVTWILLSMFRNLSVVLVCAYVCTCM